MQNAESQKMNDVLYAWSVIHPVKHVVFGSLVAISTLDGLKLVLLRFACS